MGHAIWSYYWQFKILLGISGIELASNGGGNDDDDNDDDNS